MREKDEAKRFTLQRMFKAVAIFGVLLMLAMNLRLVFNWCPTAANDLGDSYLDFHIGWRNTTWVQCHCYWYRDKDSHGNAYIGPWQVWSNYEDNN